MKKTFLLEDLDCALCAAKMEKAIGKLEGVESASINFMTRKLSLSVVDSLFDSTLEQAQKIITKIEPDCRIVS
ncbi:MAG: cation transporter [Clostridiales bacterium]|nr:cation transporter [Clostridiales bacterium]